MAERLVGLDNFEVCVCDDIASLDAITEKELYALHVRFYEEHQKWVTECPRPVPYANLAEFTRDDTFIVYVRYAGKVLGFVSGSLTHEDTTVISSVFVLSDFRRFGLSGYLIRQVIANCAAKSVVATVYHRNNDGRRLFARLGFNEECSHGWCGYRLVTTGIKNNDQNQVGFQTTGVVNRTG